MNLQKIPAMLPETERSGVASTVMPFDKAKAGFNIMEIWKDIPGYKGIYQISSLGRVKSLNRYVNHWRGGKKIAKGQIIKQYLNFGYFIIRLRYSTCRVNRLVGLSFIPNPENKPCINHINGVKTDNRVENLDWCTYSENEKHSYDVLGKKANMKTVVQYDRNGRVLNSFKSATDAAEFINKSISLISISCKYGLQTRDGYKFKYI